MADIPITHRPRRRIWPLVLLVLLIVLAAVWYWWSIQPAVQPTRTSGIGATGAVALWRPTLTLFARLV